MSRELRLCPGVGDRKCGAFLSTLDRDPHPTCTRRRGKVCTKDMTCDICSEWSAAQWEFFIKKRTYKERKKSSRPSGSVPPAPLPSPRAETPSGVSQPGTSSCFSRPLGGQGKREGSQGAPGVVSWGASSPPAGSRSSERGGSVSGLSSVVSERAPSSSAPSGADEGGVARLQRTPLARYASSAVSPPFLAASSSTWGIERDFGGPLPRGSRSSDREALKDKRACAQSGSSRDCGRRSRSLSSSRSRSRDGERRSRSLSSRVRSRRERSRSSDRYRSQRGRSRSRGDRSRYRSHRNCSRRDRSF